MRTLALLFAVVALFAVAAGASPIENLNQYINVAGTSGVYAGGGYFPMQNAFESSLNTYDEGAGTMTGADPGANSAPYYTGRWGQIDLGEQWADMRIKECWTLWRPWSGNDTYTGYTEGFFTNIDAPNITWPGPFGNPDKVAVDMNKINFVTGHQPHVGTYEWGKDTDCGPNIADWVVPTGRYLVLHMNDVDGGRAAEYAIVGTLIPEPGTVVLLSLGVIGLLRRKR